MTSIASVNSAALLILQQTGPIANSTQSGGAETDILKIANGKTTVSSEPTKASTQAAAAAGKFAVDTAPPEASIEESGYQLSSDDGGLSERMALAATAKYDRSSEEETIKMLDAFDALSVKHGRAPLHESIRSSLIKNGF